MGGEPCPYDLDAREEAQLGEDSRGDSPAYGRLIASSANSCVCWLILDVHVNPRVRSRADLGGLPTMVQSSVLRARRGPAERQSFPSESSQPGIDSDCNAEESGEQQYR